MSPPLVETEVFAEVPKGLRRSGTPPERLVAGKSATPAGSTAASRFIACRAAGATS